MKYISKQIKKDFMKNKNYILVLFLMALFTTSMYLFIRYSIDKNVENVNKYIEEYNQEDFRFKVNVFYDEQLWKDIIQKYNISEKDINMYGIETIVKNNDIDILEFETELAKKLGNEYGFTFAKREIKKTISDEKTYYFVNSLTDINKTNLLEGTLPQKDNEIAILPGYAKENKLNIGDRINIKEDVFTITGYVYLPDYMAFVPFGELEQTFEHSSFVIVGGDKFNQISGNLIEYFCGKNIENVNIENKKNMIKNDLRFDYFEEASDIEGDSLPTMGFRSNTSLAFTFFLSLLIVSIYVYFMFYYKFIQLYRKKFGLYKALGYTTDKVVKILLESTLPYIFIGSIVGTAVGYYLSSILVNRYIETYCFDGFVKGCNISTYVFGILLLPIINTIMIFIYVRYFYKEDAAILMKNKITKSKRGTYVTFCNRLCRLVPEKNKVSYRMLFRKKSNILMSFGAVAIVSTLFVMSISLYSSSEYRMKNQFDGHHYNAKEISKVYANDSTDYENFIQVPTELTLNMEKNNFDIIGLEKNSEFINLYSENNEIKVNNNSFIISKGVSILYNLKEGDKVDIKIKGQTYKETITNICNNGDAFMVYTSKEKLARMIGVSPKVHNGVFHSTNIKKVNDSHINIITIEEEKAATKADSSSNKASAIINQVIAVISGLVMFYLAIQISFQDSEKDILILRQLGYSINKIFKMTIDVYKGLIIIIYFMTYPMSVYISKFVHVSISKQTNDYIPFSTNIIVFATGFILILICYELIVGCFKLQIRRKINKNQW